MSELDAANAAPPASESERKTAFGWTALAMAIGLLALVIAGFYFYKQGQKHDEQVTAIKTAPVVLPSVAKPPIYKRVFKPATKEVATPPVDVTKTVEKSTKKPVENDGFTNEFEKRLIEFERKIPK